MRAVQVLLDKYIFHKQQPETPPPISTGTAVALLVLYTVVYVAPFYLSPLTRPSATLSRDAPSVIRARIASVTLSCVHPHVPWATVAARALLQFAYTTLFGSYATFLYLRTGSLLAVCAVHSFCNSMGLPRVWGRVQRAPLAAAGDAAIHNASGAAVRGKDDDDNANAAAAAAPVRPSPARTRDGSTILWTLAYYVLLVAGAVFWYRNLWSLTESPLALASF
ncbi:CaaX prenyl proteinase Rce1 [Niveomyces insectorum RCEF 264]|uniref:intramembrane prenyl-peptidase Rce1 n=1 Tax=Niveomyces insectorum RCEF 264 TaxID=1081102 RepID=A0A167QQX5_9HYPO|nr:CaaX prenyl proteinase Rce1 [Niveomyces insectorum RCEF 264]